MVVGIGRGRCGSDVDSGLRGITKGDRGGDRHYGDSEILSQWEDNIANITLGVEHNAPLAYDPGLEHHQPIIITLGDPRGQLYRYIYREKQFKISTFH